MKDRDGRNSWEQDPEALRNCLLIRSAMPGEDFMPVGGEGPGVLKQHGNLVIKATWRVLASIVLKRAAEALLH